MERMREMMDYIVGGFFFLTAPLFPQITRIPAHASMSNFEQYDNVLTLLIQALSVVLLVTRIVKTWNDDEREKD